MHHERTILHESLIFSQFSENGSFGSLQDAYTISYIELLICCSCSYISSLVVNKITYIDQKLSGIWDIPMLVPSLLYTSTSQAFDYRSLQKGGLHTL